jgi:hypothetical protein
MLASLPLFAWYHCGFSDQDLLSCAATWMLEVSGGAAKMHTEAVKADFTALYRSSETCRRTEKTAADIAASAKQNCMPLSLKTQYAASQGQQIRQVAWKLFLVYWCASYGVLDQLKVVYACLLARMTSGIRSY